MATIRRTALLFVSIILISVAGASPPQVNFPISSQAPPVARAGQPFQFQFASTTFEPEPDRLQYSLIGNPLWLSIHGHNRTLYGTPRTKDVGTVTFTITAAGEAGAVANLDSSLVVTEDRGPTLNTNVSEVLSKAGQLSGPKRLALLPSQPFEIDFPADTFISENKNTFYFASLDNHTPLPSWISFDADAIRFAGTPPATSIPQVYDVLLMVSNLPGYATASLSFSLVVSNHQFFFNPLQDTITVNKGDEVNIKGLREHLLLDGSPILDSDVGSASADVPSWLSFDENTLDVKGNPPSGLMSQDIEISVIDRFGDAANHSIHLVFKSALFTGELGRINITAGRYFEYQIPSSVLANKEEQVRIDFGSLAKWLGFNSANLTMSGTIPKDHSPVDTQATIIATSKDGNMKDMQSFHVHISGSDAVGDEPTGTGATGEFAHPPSKRAGVIAGATVGALIGASIFIALLLVLCRRKKKQDGYISPRVPRSPRKVDISRPIMIHDEWERHDNSFDRDLEKAGSREKTPEHPPQLNLDLAMRRKASQSFSSDISESETKILTAFDRSSWGFKDEAGPSHRPHESMKIPTAMARRESEKSNATTAPVPTQRPKSAVYRDSHHSSGPPVNRRLTELGHSRQTPSRSNNSVSGLRRPLSNNSYSTKSTSILSTVPSALPQSPAAKHITQLTIPKDKRRSVRLVASPSNALIDRNLVDRRTIDEKRRSYIRKRASNQFPAPFFGADSDRSSSAAYKSPPAFINDSEPPSMPAPSPEISRVAAKSGDGDATKFERELPASLRIRKPSETPSVEPPQSTITFTGSLRKPPTARSFTNRYTTSAISDQRRVQKRYERAGAPVYPGTDIPRRSSTRQSLRAQELKSSLNNLTGSKIFDDAEMSESVYSTEEEDIEEYERRTTIKAGQYTLPPLKLNSSKPRRKGSKRSSNRDSRRDDKNDLKRDTKVAIKKISERDPTPFSLALEHGGKENHSSTYSLDLTSYHKGKAKSTQATQSPERPKTTIATTTPSRQRSSRQPRAESRTTARSSTAQRDGDAVLSDRQSQYRSRHSRTQSRYSTTKQGRDRSRTQSSAYPYFDAATAPLTTPTAEEPPSPSKSDKENIPSLPADGSTEASLISRDTSGNVLNYAEAEDPTIEILNGSSIGFRTSNGRINSSARRSRLARSFSDQQAQNLPPSVGAPSRRNTAVPGTNSNRNSHAADATIGLGLDLTGGGYAGQLPEPESNVQRGRERLPLSVLDDGNGNGNGDAITPSSPEHLRIGETKAKRPISSEVDEELKVGNSRKGRRTWGRSIRRIVPSGSSNIWGSGAGDRETKAFL
ncbi:hypothetical protein BU24DRAFT_494142 [Aaosphaeria arxii CBS 175.79]|uniref:Dystroglycan-type cadherin-like domain-containing protein n=1 Tax=Aaosphaeria arxii CBS 175.79 TaxID=1450172 RepID=A0A6A5XLM8_9PLEO|nr:uncharacterized protein BU24DRAFT_494142 [Aaosphaeria arxii CBS 175.79]KAF2013717.1 hypothetical protein BU24DRAFT_494142 [Aaosphaeria arxii CBS 175.79]